MSEAEDSTQPDFLNDEDSRPALPAADFDFLIYSLRLQAELNLGLLPFGGDETKPDFELGRHNIDLLAMLQEKTKGNLTAGEQRDLDNSVAELRFRFVQAMQAESDKQA
jgi:hypothetical protein